ncbi:MAG TPA: cupin domain-containing protein, partial [Acidimicrobiia bacterium]|nr:cupin domain-containing protein [Acidimicrobiia bacterium]
AATAKPSGMTITEVSKATLASEAYTVDFRQGKETRVLKLVLEPGGTTGWHRHPQHGLFLVDKGTLTSYGLDGPPCEPVEFTPGKALSAGPHSQHAHLVRNLGTEPLEVTVLYFNLAAGEPGAVAADRPAECPTTLN